MGGMWDLESAVGAFSATSLCTGHQPWVLDPSPQDRERRGDACKDCE